MKQNLQRTSEGIELFLNYAVVFCIEIALNALIGDRVPVGVWLAAALYPVCFYLFRKKGKHFWVFFLLPVAGLIIVFLYQKFGQEDGGTNQVLSTIRSQDDVPFRSAI